MFYQQIVGARVPDVVRVELGKRARSAELSAATWAHCSIPCKSGRSRCTHGSRVSPTAISGTIYVDAKHNARGRRMASAYSVRATDVATVSAPLRTRNLTCRLRTSAFSTKTMPARSARLGDLWGEMLTACATTQALVKAMRVLEQVLGTASEAAKPPRGQSRSRKGR